MRRGFSGCHGFARGIENLPGDSGVLGLLALIHHHRRERQRGGASVERGAHSALPLAEVQRIGFGEPDVAIDAGTLVEPAVAKAGVNASHDVILCAEGEEVGEVESKGGVAVVVAADEATIDEEQHVSESPVEFDSNAAALVGGGDVEFAPVPSDAGFWIAAADGFEPVGVLLFVVHKGQLDGPVMRQVQGAPFGVVESCLGELEVTGLGKITLAETEVEVFGGVRTVAKEELPSKVEEQLLTRRHSGQSLGRRNPWIG